MGGGGGEALRSESDSEGAEGGKINNNISTRCPAVFFKYSNVDFATSADMIQLSGE